VITKEENSSYQSITIKNEKMTDKLIEISQLRGLNVKIYLAIHSSEIRKISNSNM
jgi:hypothetical protein